MYPISIYLSAWGEARQRRGPVQRPTEASSVCVPLVSQMTALVTPQRTRLVRRETTLSRSLLRASRSTADLASFDASCCPPPPPRPREGSCLAAGGKKQYTMMCFLQATATPVHIRTIAAWTVMGRMRRRRSNIALVLGEVEPQQLRVPCCWMLAQNPERDHCMGI